MIRAALWLAATLQAQDSASLTLMTAVERALRTHPATALARAQRDRAWAEASEAGGARRPHVSVDASLNRFEEPMVVQPLHEFDPRNPPLFNRALLQSGLNLNWTVLDFGRRGSRIRAQRAFGEAADAGVTGAEQLLIARVVAAYLQVVAAQELVEAQNQRLAALRAESGRVHQLLGTGKASRVEVLRVDAEVQRVTAERIESEAKHELAARELSQLSGTPYESVASRPLGAVRLAGESLDTTPRERAAWIERAADRSPELRQYAQRVTAASARMRAARASWYPELRLAGAYIDRGRWWGDFAGEWQVGLALSYSLYTGGTRGSLIDQALADERAASSQLRLAQLDIEKDVDRALAMLREAGARSRALQAALDQSMEVVRIERLSLEVGSGTQTDYLLAEANLVTTRASLTGARHGEISARVELARILGDLSPDWLARNVELSR
jgi:outer membrane protein